MTLTEPVMPDTITAVRSYLLTVDELTQTGQGKLGGRVYYGAIPADPIFPVVRISDLTTSEDVRHAWARSLMQLDVWHSDGRQRDCRALAELIRAALVASTGYVGDGFTLGGPDNVTGVSMAPFGSGFDDTFKPPRPRYLITAALLIRN
jgi:hypothetical protein